MAQGHPERFRGSASRRLALLVSTAVLAAAITAGAQADDPNPNPLGNPDTIGGDQRPDTDLTPDYKDAPMWKQRGGADFKTNAMMPGSPTSFDDDLTAIAFDSPTNGFAGGSRTIDCGGEKKPVPVMYGYRETPDHGVAWDRAFLG